MLEPAPATAYRQYLLTQARTHRVERRGKGEERPSCLDLFEGRPTYFDLLALQGRRHGKGKESTHTHGRVRDGALETTPASAHYSKNRTGKLQPAGERAATIGWPPRQGLAAIGLVSKRTAPRLPPGAVCKTPWSVPHRQKKEDIGSIAAETSVCVGGVCVLVFVRVCVCVRARLRVIVSAGADLVLDERVGSPALRSVSCKALVLDGCRERGSKEVG